MSQSCVKENILEHNRLFSSLNDELYINNTRLNNFNYFDSVISQPTPVINYTSNLLINPELIDYDIPSHYQQLSNGSIVYGQPNTYYKAYCVPTTFANILNYYNDPSKNNLGIQLNYTTQNSHPPLTDYLYNYQGRPLTATGVTDINKIELGYFFNTNAYGFDLSNGSYNGTKLQSFLKFVDFMNVISPNAKYSYYYKGFGINTSIYYEYTNISGGTLNTSYYNINDINNIFNNIKEEINNNRPVILSFNHWNIIVSSNYAGSKDISGKTVNLYEFGPQVGSTLDIQNSNSIYSNPEYIEETWDPEGGLGHTVTCVGYFEDNSNNWVIVQDNINTTSKYVGLPLDASYFSMPTYL